VIAAKWLTGGVMFLVALFLIFLSFLAFVSFVSGDEMEALSNEGIGVVGLIAFLFAVPFAFVANYLMRSALTDMRSGRETPPE